MQEIQTFTDLINRIINESNLRRESSSSKNSYKAKRWSSRSMQRVYFDESIHFWQNSCNHIHWYLFISIHKSRIKCCWKAFCKRFYGVFMPLVFSYLLSLFRELCPHLYHNKADADTYINKVEVLNSLAFHSRWWTEKIEPFNCDYPPRLACDSSDYNFQSFDSSHQHSS